MYVEVMGLSPETGNKGETLNQKKGERERGREGEGEREGERGREGGSQTQGQCTEGSLNTQYTYNYVHINTVYTSQEGNSQGVEGECGGSVSPGNVWRESVPRQGVEGVSPGKAWREFVPRQGVEGVCPQARRGGRVSPGKVWRECVPRQGV